MIHRPRMQRAPSRRYAAADDAARPRPPRGSVIVFGGSGGLGQAIGTRLAEGWPAVAFTCHANAERAEQLRASLSPRCATAFLKADVRRDEDVAAALAMADDM